MIRYAITYVNKDGLRTLSHANQGRFFQDTREECQAKLDKFLEVTSDSRWAEVYGPQSVGTFRVDAFDCYDHGDAKGIYVDEENPL